MTKDLFDFLSLKILSVFKMVMILKICNREGEINMGVFLDNLSVSLIGKRCMVA